MYIKDIFYNMRIAISLFMLIISSCSLSFDCEEYKKFIKNTELKGEVTKFLVDGRRITIGLKYDGQNKESRLSIYELYTNEDKINVGDTLIKEKGELRWFIHNQRGVDTIYTECGEVRAPYTE